MLIDHLIANLAEADLWCVYILLLIRSQEGVNCDLDCLIKDLGNDSLEQDTFICFQARVRIALDQVNLKVRVYHKVKSHQLKPVVVRAHLAYEAWSGSLKDLTNPVLDLNQYCVIELDPLFLH